jgi:hypothetical protein
MVKANIPVKYWYHLFRDAFITPTDLDGMVVLEIEGKRATRYEHMFGKNPEWSGHLRTFCESGTVKIKTDTTPKLHDEGVKCMFVGYAGNHNGGVYWMWNPHTSKVHITRNVIFLKRMLFQTTVDEIATVPTLAQDNTVEAGKSGINAEKAVEVEPSGGVDNDEHSHSMSNSDTDREEATPEGTAEPTGDGEWHTTTRSGRTCQLSSRYSAETPRISYDAWDIFLK